MLVPEKVDCGDLESRKRLLVAKHHVLAANLDKLNTQYTDVFFGQLKNIQSKCLRLKKLKNFLWV